MFFFSYLSRIDLLIHLFRSAFTCFTNKTKVNLMTNSNGTVPWLWCTHNFHCSMCYSLLLRVNHFNQWQWEAASATVNSMNTKRARTLQKRGRSIGLNAKIIDNFNISHFLASGAETEWKPLMNTLTCNGFDIKFKWVRLWVPLTLSLSLISFCGSTLNTSVYFIPYFALSNLQIDAFWWRKKNYYEWNKTKEKWGRRIEADWRKKII